MSKSPNYNPHTLLCQEMSGHAGDMIKTAYGSNTSSFFHKDDKSFVTTTDTKVEAYYLDTIHAHYPEHNIHSEESGDHQNGSKYTWYLDPLDGTSNYIFGVPLFGTMIALSKGNDLISSCLNLPLSNITFTAQKGEGSYLNHRRLTLPDAIPLSQITMMIDCGKSLIAHQTKIHILSQISDKVRSIRQFGCVCAHSLLFQHDHLHFSMVIGADPHDLLPNALIYQESGLLTLNRYFQPWSITDPDLIAIHPSLKTDIEKIIQFE
jgi:fructose-1,6-bisphosphatase/inositol monophosphatase family enzyme